MQKNRKVQNVAVKLKNIQMAPVNYYAPLRTNQHQPNPLKKIFNSWGTSRAENKIQRIAIYKFIITVF